MISISPSTGEVVVHGLDDLFQQVPATGSSHTDGISKTGKGVLLT